MTKYIIGYSKPNKNYSVIIEYFFSETLQGIQKRAEQVRGYGCNVHKFGRYNPKQKLPEIFEPQTEKDENGNNFNNWTKWL